MSVKRFVEKESFYEYAKKEEIPKNYKVLLHNDHYTTMEFVVMILREVFGKSDQDSVNIMLQVHRGGQGIAGIYSYDIARTKVEIVHSRSKEESFPLKCTIEEV